MLAITARRALRLVTPSRQALWIATIVVLVAGVVFSPWVMGTAAAQADPTGCADPSASCSGSQTDFNDILDAMFTVVYDALKYVAFVAVVLGGILYVTASRSTSRAALGVSMFWGGIGLAILWFGFGAFVGAMEWIASGGGGGP